MSDSDLLFYYDGNANTYVIDASGKDKFIEYIPVKKEESSSGVYSGGNYKKASISDEEFREIKQIFTLAILNTKIHINNRVMLSGMIKYTENRQTIIIIIEPGAVEKDRIELKLKEILK